ncbi:MULTISPECIES: hypothetical protein [unclassified Streptomyces]|uniref:hypothetical protein n=1 Tax=unclassified Streptomyces TaxID=2593676 RepID=UPI00380A1B95
MRISKKTAISVTAVMSLVLLGEMGAQTAMAVNAPTIKSAAVSQATSNAAIANARKAVVDKLTAQGATAAQIATAQQNFDKALAQGKTAAQHAPAAGTTATQATGVPKFEYKTYDQLLELARKRLAEVKAGKPEDQRTSLVSSLPKAQTYASMGNVWKGADKIVNEVAGRYATFDGLRKTIESGDDGLLASLSQTSSVLALASGHYAGAGALLGLGGAVANIFDPSVLNNPTKLRDAIANFAFSAGYAAGYLVGLSAGPVGAVISAVTVAGQLIYALATEGWDAFVKDLTLNGAAAINLFATGLFGENDPLVRLLNQPDWNKIENEFADGMVPKLSDLQHLSWVASFIKIAEKQGKAGWESYQYLEQLAASFTAYAEVQLDYAYQHSDDHGQAAQDSLKVNKQALRDELAKHLKTTRDNGIKDQAGAIKAEVFKQENKDGYTEMGGKVFGAQKYELIVDALRASGHQVTEYRRDKKDLDYLSVDGAGVGSSLVTHLGRGYDNASNRAKAQGEAAWVRQTDIGKGLGLTDEQKKAIDKAITDAYGDTMKIGKVAVPTEVMKNKGGYLIADNDECMGDNGSDQPGVVDCSSSSASAWEYSHSSGGSFQVRLRGKGYLLIDGAFKEGTAVKFKSSGSLLIIPNADGVPTIANSKMGLGSKDGKLIISSTFNVKMYQDGHLVTK